MGDGNGQDGHQRKDTDESPETQPCAHHGHIGWLGPGLHLSGSDEPQQADYHDGHHDRNGEQLLHYQLAFEA